ncbi:hypothetical protein [Paenibacillus tianmuensis]|uniref:hypothetical protein n=1 Tax=Paenibacillus tianmuensis TaxID=624147 RepID=UPI000B815BEF|nr:hypothetical protein [Paenibacillus tianmuensis]
MLDKLAGWFESLTLPILQAYKERWEVGQIRINEYDTIEGLAGIGRVTMIFADRPQMKIIWHKIIELFHIFCGSKKYCGDEISAWHIPSTYQFLYKLN